MEIGGIRLIETSDGCRRVEGGGNWKPEVDLKSPLPRCGSSSVSSTRSREVGAGGMERVNSGLGVDSSG